MANERKPAPGPAAPPSAPLKPARYEPPFDPELGQVVLWKHGLRQGDWAPAIVTEVGSGGCVSLTMFAKDSRAGNPKSGVRHVDDPWLLDKIEVESGVWDFTDRDKALQIVLLANSIAGGDSV